MLVIPFPSIDPVAIPIYGELAIRWYALAYLAGFILGWRLCLKLAKDHPQGPAPALYDEFLTWAVIGVLLGGRIGYVLFYQADYYTQHPMEMFEVWHGGMSFHGGMIGVISAAWIFTRRKKVGFFYFTDLLAVVTPIGLFFGRVANFINGELYGRAADVPWAMAFPRGGDVPRHPSQLYEAGLEGLVLFLILYAIARRLDLRMRPGLLSGVFLFGYGLFRCALEFFREPDVQLGFLVGGATMGQLLCLPMMAYGLYLILWSERRARRREP